MPEPLAPSSATFSPRSSTMSTSRTRVRTPAGSSAEPTLRAGVFISSTTRAEGLGCGRPSLKLLVCLGGSSQAALDALDLRELGLGLLRLVLLGVKAVVEALQLGDLLEVLLVLAPHEVEARLALAQIGGEVAALGLDVLVLDGQHAPAHLLEQARSWVTRTKARG